MTMATEATLATAPMYTSRQSFMRSTNTTPTGVKYFSFSHQFLFGISNMNHSDEEHIYITVYFRSVPVLRKPSAENKMFIMYNIKE